MKKTARLTLLISVLFIVSCASTETEIPYLEPTATPQTDETPSAQPTHSYYFQALNGLIITQNEIEIKVIDVGKTAQAVYVDICFTLPDDKNDWFVSFETSALVKSDAREQSMNLRKIKLIGFEPFYPFPDPTHRCDRLLFESTDDEPEMIELTIENLVGISKKRANCDADDLTYEDQIIIGTLSCTSTDGSNQANLPDSITDNGGSLTIEGLWIFDIKTP
ncbi:MAG: hypothetical protein Q8M94_11105 [Ignavibacteria bacterium]|nr:hypothetical protein [Ignavibacteria bacterium]